MQENECYDGPLTGNVKCVLISLALAFVYWFAPPKNKWILAGILYSTYLAIAWYDAYLCERTLAPSYLRHFYDWAKPRDSYQSQQYRRLCKSAERKILVVDVLVALALVAGLPYFIRWKPS